MSNVINRNSQIGILFNINVNVFLETYLETYPSAFIILYKIKSMGGHCPLDLVHGYVVKRNNVMSKHIQWRLSPRGRFVIFISHQKRPRVKRKPHTLMMPTTRIENNKLIRIIIYDQGDTSALFVFSLWLVAGNRQIYVCKTNCVLLALV